MVDGFMIEVGITDLQVTETADPASVGRSGKNPE